MGVFVSAVADINTSLFAVCCIYNLMLQHTQTLEVLGFLTGKSSNHMAQADLDFGQMSLDVV